MTVVQCLRIGASTHELFSSLSLVSSTAPQPGVLSALYCFAVSIAVLPAGMGPPGPQSWTHRRVLVAVTPRTRMFLRGGLSCPVLEPMTLGALGTDTFCLTRTWVFGETLRNTELGSGSQTMSGASAWALKCFSDSFPCAGA